MHVSNTDRYAARGVTAAIGGFDPHYSKAGFALKSAPSGNIPEHGLEKVFLVCLLAYLTAYATEAPIRYGLYLAGKDNLIFVRDSLIILPLLLLFAARALKQSIMPIFLIVGALFAFHGLVLMGTIGSIKGVAYGVKMLINLLFGFLAAGLLIAPGKKAFRFLILIWLVTVVGVCLDKFVLTFPWTGIKTIIGDLNVDVSKDWEIQDSFARRVAGFTRSSICVAVFLPPLTIVLLSRIRRWILRAALLAAAFGAVVLTTQKGAIVAFAPVAAILCLPEGSRLRPLRICCLAFLTILVVLPIVTLGLHMDHGSGVFSTESIFLRIAYTWPQAFDWIWHHQMLVFGVGLGGLGGPQRIYAPDDFNPADNLFILMYAYFGIFAFVYLLAMVALVRRRITGRQERAETAIAVLAFAFGYGIVLSMLEDQSAPLFMGAALGVLWCETRASRAPAANARTWSSYVADWPAPSPAGRPLTNPQ